MTQNDKLYIKFSIKMLIFLGGAFLWIVTVISIVDTSVEEMTDYYGTDAYIVNTLDEYYYEKDYGKLYDYMNLYEAYEDTYDVYWEVMDTYIDMKEYQKWSKVSDEQIKGAKEMMEMYQNKVIESAKTPTFPQNQKYLNEFVEMLDEAE